MKSCPVIVTEGEEAANHHSTASGRIRAKREMHGGPEGKTEANGGEALRIKAILVTTPKLTSSPKAPFTVEASPKTTISKVGVCKSARRTCSFLHSGFSHWVFRNGVFSEAYRRRVLRAFLMAEGVGRSGPIHMYSATPLCCASQTEVAEGLLLGEWPSPCKG